MRILFAFPATGYYTRALSNPQGLLSVATYLKQHGHDVKITDRNIDRVSMERLIKDFCPDVFGCSVMSNRGLRDALAISRKAKKHGLPVVWGGQMPSMQAELVLASGCVDIVSVGEGEETWLELTEYFGGTKKLSEILSVAYLENGKMIKTPDRPFADLKDMPILDFSLIRTEKYLQKYLGCERLMYIYSAKGCPCRCAFCSNNCFHRSTFRKRPNEYVIEEIKYLVDHYGLDGVYFTDELWTVNKSDVHEFCRMVRENDLHFHWCAQLRIGLMGEEEYRAMYEAGCRWIFFGVESGSKEMLEKVHKNIDYDKIVPTFRLLESIGITGIASFIIGYPDETEDQLRDTVRMINRCRAGLVTVYHFTPLPGTELYNELIAAKRYEEPASLKESGRVVATESLGINFSAVPDKDLRVIRSWYNWRGFSSKNAVKNGKSFEFALDTIVSGLHSISQKGVISFFVNGFAAFKEFVYVFWYSHAYGDIIKKYGLNTDYPEEK